MIILGLALLGGPFPMTNHMTSMPAMHMEAPMATQIHNSEGQMHGSVVDNSSGSCCDAVCPASMVCAFLVPESTDTALSGDSEQFSNSDLTTQLIYLTALAPPPKA